MKNFGLKNLAFLLVGILFLGAGLFSLVSGSQVDKDYKQLLATGAKTSAVATDVTHRETTSRKNGKTKRKTYEKITVTFKDDKGNDRKIVNEKRLNGARAAKGATYTVFYDKTNPDRAVIEGKNSSGEVKTFGVIFLLLGGISLGLLTFSKIKEKKAAGSP